MYAEVGKTRRREATQRGRLPQPKTLQVKDRIFNRDGQICRMTWQKLCRKTFAGAFRCDLPESDYNRPQK
jgi:hypothetical protein